MSRSSAALNGHILNTSGTMVGVCMTVISLVKILERQLHTPSRLDELLALTAVVFVVAAFLSYLSLRAEQGGRLRRSMALERVADLLFVTGLAAMGMGSVLFAFEFI